jgi:hypothetical protein
MQRRLKRGIDMTAAEWMELYASSTANGLTAQATLLTLVSGYIVVAYIAGARLTTLQVSVANLVYLGGSISTLISNYVSVFDALNAKAQAAALEANIPSMFTDGQISLAGPAALVALLNALFIVASLCFMWQVRHPKE